jgi:outer membrane protein OmpA-like peptidoglycan-associated protein
MKLFYISLFCIAVLSLETKAQDFLGYVNSNYAGVTGTDLQPASMVDSRFDFDMTFIGLNLSASNNFVGLRKEALKRKGSSFPAFDDTNFANNYLEIRKSSKTKSLFLSSQLQAFNFMGSIGKRFAYCVKIKTRTMFNIDGLSSELGSLVYNQLDVPDLWQRSLVDNHLSIQTMSWAEYGIGFGTVLKAKGKHFLKAAGTVKLLQGIQAAYFYADNINYSFKNDTLTSIFNSDIKYGHSDNFDFDNHKFKGNAYSVGFDFGVVYEWRPKFEEYKYEMDGQKDLVYKHKNKYKLKVGLSVLDIGSLTFKKGEYSRDFNVNISNWNIRNVNPLDVASFDDTLNLNNFIKLSDKSVDSKFTMSLPTTISMQIDYNIWKDFYLNLTPYYALYNKGRESKLHEVTAISIAPRWDHKWFGVFVPVSRDVNDNTMLGLGLRLGPLVVGSNNLLPYINGKSFYAGNIYTLIKIPIMYKATKDKDHDKVSDKIDRCLDVAGVWEFYGCPDRDGDHVEDKDDQCPDNPGLPEFKGCPDKDGDRIIDKLDDCPDDAGLAKFNGCPDKDDDGIIDKNDECPDDAGLTIYNGCPDKDGDGLIDKTDKCPEKAGPTSNNGCPEVKLQLIDKAGTVLRSVIKGKDGSFTFDELPPDEQVIFKMVSEGENVDDIKDIRVNIGIVSKKALKDAKDGLFRFIVLKTDVNKLAVKEVIDVPIKLNMEESIIVRTAFNNLEFMSGKDVIKTESLGALDKLADLMMKKPEARLKLAGHTDNQGNPAANQKLSLRRAEAVKKYLLAKGIIATRFKTEGFGDKKPIDDNKTPEGRQRNRRVEMTLIQ